MKICFECKKLKDKDEFYHHKNHKDELSSRCKECHKRNSSRYYKKNWEKRRQYRKEWFQRKGKELQWKRTGARDMTLERYNEMYMAQKGKCFLCGRHQSEIGKPLDVDHNHATGEVRSLLCRVCNLMVGQVENEADRIQRVRMYLGGFEKREEG